MKRLLLITILGVLVGLGVYGYLTRPCFAGICAASWRCISSAACPSGCVCAKRGTEIQGECMGTSRAVDGWEILP